MNEGSRLASEPAAPWSIHRVRGPLAGMLPLVFSALVALGGSYPLACLVLAAVSLVATVNLLRMRAAAH